MRNMRPASTEAARGAACAKVGRARRWCGLSGRDDYYSHALAGVADLRGPLVDTLVPVDVSESADRPLQIAFFFRLDRRVSFASRRRGTRAPARHRRA